ncbi:MAG: hypothetical protein Q8N14_03910 [Candidatus Omnitrophota bacterium]|nr:hypothetical protein [Candidatus Omnitrophota bacterium]
MEEYHLYQDKKFTEYEALCHRCGSCCGIQDGDPCENLAFTDDEKSFCEIYGYRFGLRQTIAGKKFLCVPIRKILFKTWSGCSQCAYHKIRL